MTNTFDYLTGLEIMERVSAGEDLEAAIRDALAVKAACDADPWHLAPDAGGRLRCETLALAGRVAQRNGL